MNLVLFSLTLSEQSIAYAESVELLALKTSKSFPVG